MCNDLESFVMIWVVAGQEIKNDAAMCRQGLGTSARLCFNLLCSCLCKLSSLRKKTSHNYAICHFLPLSLFPILIIGILLHWIIQTSSNFSTIYSLPFFELSPLLHNMTCCDLFDWELLIGQYTAQPWFQSQWLHLKTIHKNDPYQCHMAACCTYHQLNKIS